MYLSWGCLLRYGKPGPLPKIFSSICPIAMYRKSDSDDAEAIALATLNMLDKLPDAYPNDAYWSLGQLVHRRDNIMKQRTRLVNQLHEQLCIAYPSYKQFFNDISRPTALYFWEHYPSRKYLKGKSVDVLHPLPLPEAP